MHPSFLHCGKFKLSLSRPLIMGVVNVTPDSFSDGGLLPGASHAIAHALRLIEEGADLLDIGGESTRPGALPVSVDDELQRVLPVLEGLRGVQVPVSVDTQKPVVMRAAIAAGASMINDINAMQADGAWELVAESDVALCLMHKQGSPLTMQRDPQYHHAVREVRDFLFARVSAAEQHGIARERLIIDPGFGFGKRLEHNLALLQHLDQLATLGIPILAGLSRKSMLGKITGRDVGQRVYASIAAAILAAQNGASILRVHDVAATKDAFQIINALEKSND